MELLSKMEQHEMLLSKLYEIFAKRLPEQKEFWLDLSQEETMHALWIKSFSKKVSEDQLQMGPTTIKVSAIQTSIESLENIIRDSDNKKIDMTYALSIAVNYENSLIEKYAMEHYTASSPLLIKLIETLRTASESHREMVNTAYQKIRQTRPN